MAFLVSTGLKNYWLGTDDLAAGLNGGKIKMYGSPTSQDAANALIPATADAAIGSATLICTITVDGTGGGLNFNAAPAAGILTKSSTELWLATVAASGWFSFYRWVQTADDGTSSTVFRRLQGTVGILGTELVVAEAFKAISTEQRVDSYVLGMP